MAKTLLELFPTLKCNQKGVEPFVSLLISIAFHRCCCSQKSIFSMRFTIRKLVVFWVRNLKTWESWNLKNFQRENRPIKCVLLLMIKPEWKPWLMIWNQLLSTNSIWTVSNSCWLKLQITVTDWCWINEQMSKRHSLFSMPIQNW